MAEISLRAALYRLHPAPAGVTDAQLLERFATHGDETAFELLLRRHAGMVWQVCRRVLRDPHHAEDAFQATFLILVRKAGSIAKRGALAGWLYRVAYHAALRARSRVERRAVREKQALDLELTVAAADPVPEFLRRDLWSVLDRELNALPEKYRAAVVLCYLEGKTYDEAARQLGCPKGTLSTRLTQAREILRQRLARQGVALSGGGLAAYLGRPTTAAGAPVALVEATWTAARRFALEPTAVTNMISAEAFALARGVLRTMFLTKLKLAAGALAVLVAGLAVASWTYQAPAGEPGHQRPAHVPTPVNFRKEVGDVRSFHGHTAPVLCVAFSSDGRRILSSSMDATVRLWDVETGKELRRLQGHTDRVDCVTFVPGDDRRALSCAWDGTVRLWDLDRGRQLQCFHPPGRPGIHLTNVIFFRDGKRILVNAVDNDSLLIMDIETGKVVKEFAQHPDHVPTVALSPDERWVLEGNWDGRLRLWDIASGKLLRTFSGPDGKIYKVAFSPDGRRALAGALEDHAVYVWDVGTGKELRRFEGHARHVDWVAFSPDGRRALSCGPDQTVRLWHVETGMELRRLFGHTDRVTCVAFSTDGRYAISGGYDKAVRLWRLPR
jgi:RNA polymerase sigma factor (sigma-70 family)